MHFMRWFDTFASTLIARMPERETFDGLDDVWEFRSKLWGPHCGELNFSVDVRPRHETECGLFPHRQASSFELRMIIPYSYLDNWY